MAPVPWKELGLEDYPQIIKKPMDLGTIQTKLESNKYPSADKFAADVRLVWRNAQTYNQQGSEIYVSAENLSKLFEKKFSKIKKPAIKKYVPHSLFLSLSSLPL